MSTVNFNFSTNSQPEQQKSQSSQSLKSCLKSSLKSNYASKNTKSVLNTDSVISTAVIDKHWGVSAPPPTINPIGGSVITPECSVYSCHMCRNILFTSDDLLPHMDGRSGDVSSSSSSLSKNKKCLRTKGKGAGGFVNLAPCSSSSAGDGLCSSLFLDSNIATWVIKESSRISTACTQKGENEENQRMNVDNVQEGVEGDEAKQKEATEATEVETEKKEEEKVSGAEISTCTKTGEADASAGQGQAVDGVSSAATTPSAAQQGQSGLSLSKQKRSSTAAGTCSASLVGVSVEDSDEEIIGSEDDDDDFVRNKSKKNGSKPKNSSASGGQRKSNNKNNNKNSSNSSLSLPRKTTATTIKNTTNNSLIPTTTLTTCSSEDGCTKEGTVTLCPEEPAATCAEVYVHTNNDECSVTSHTTSSSPTREQRAVHTDDTNVDNNNNNGGGNTTCGDSGSGSGCGGGANTAARQKRLERREVVAATTTIQEPLDVIYCPHCACEIGRQCWLGSKCYACTAWVQPPSFMILPRAVDVVPGALYLRSYE